MWHLRHADPQSSTPRWKRTTCPAGSKSDQFAHACPNEKLHPATHIFFVVQSRVNVHRLELTVAGTKRQACCNTAVYKPATTSHAQSVLTLHCHHGRFRQAVRPCEQLPPLNGREVVCCSTSMMHEMAGWRATWAKTQTRRTWASTCASTHVPHFPVQSPPPTIFFLREEPACPRGSELI